MKIKKEEKKKVMVVCIYIQNIKHLKSENIFSLILSKVKKHGVKTKKAINVKKNEEIFFNVSIQRK